ncbi:MAG: PAS domain-containing protein [Hyphomicrobiaceae bacterium]|nr:PAS domain-containing protein [Hyphomicrobiaceae bacterium]
MQLDNDALADVFPGESRMSMIMRQHDWQATPLGPARSWPDALKVPLRMMLTSRFEMWLGWGPDLAFFYNDAYIPTLGEKHGRVLGLPLREVWSEVYADVEDRLESVRQGKPTWDQALMLLLERHGYKEETYHTFSYSPLMSNSGSVEGLLCVVTEETERVISERWLATARTLATSLLYSRTRDAVLEGTRSALRSNTRDFPFHAIELFGSVGRTPDFEGTRWPLLEAAEGRSITLPLDGLIAQPPRGAWDVAPRSALIVPIPRTDSDNPHGALILGLNPFQAKTRQITELADLLASQIGTALGAADAIVRETNEKHRLRALFEQSPSFMAVLRGPEHRYESANPKYLDIVGQRDLIGKPVREALPELDGQGFFELLDQVYLSGEPFTGRSIPLTIGPEDPEKTGQQRYLDFVYQPIRDEAGAVTGIFVEGFDVTVAYQAREAIQKSELEFRTLAEVMPNQVWTARPDGQLDWFNNRVFEFSGKSQKELAGAGWSSIVEGEDLPVANDLWARALQTGEPYETQFRLKAADGELRWHIARAVAVRDDAGIITRWIGTNTDIQDQKTTAQALADLNATLEHQVVQRTGELMVAEEALRQAQKMEAVGQLTGGIAHDFNNLLTGIIGSLDMMTRRSQQGRSGDIERYASAAMQSARRAAALTHRLLAFSRRQPLDPQPVNANRLVTGMEEMLRRTLGAAISLEMVTAAGLWQTKCDPNQLENSILNLAINARDAMPDGGSLTIETGNAHLDNSYAATNGGLVPGQYVMISVTDTGCGMSADVAQRAFDPFFTTKPIGQGTGLGLSMIYGFARQSEGYARIYSEVGRGTTFKLYLPRYFGELVEREDLANTEVAQEQRSTRKEVVAVVEDEPAVRALVVDLLDELGYRSIEAADGVAGLKIMQGEDRIDLLVTDIGLPGLNGRQLADAARLLRPGLKVLFMTGYAENAAIAGGFLAPGMEMMTKPFAIDALAGKIKSIIDRP